MPRPSAATAAMALACLSLAVTACGSSPVVVGSSGVDGLRIPLVSPDPEQFVAEVDNPLFPLDPGTVWTYEDDTTGRQTTVRVTERSRLVQGVQTTVVDEQVRGAGGRLVERTHELYAQDRAGNVWAFGERVTSYAGPGTSGAGSWEAGAAGAQAGLTMPAQPRVGDGWEQELLVGVAEDRVRVLGVEGSVAVPYGSYDAVVQTEVTSLLEPGLVERHHYAPGAGLVLRETVAGGEGRVELVGRTVP